MTKIIDTNNDTTRRLAQFKADGIETVIRYISTNTSGEKTVKPAEAKAIAAAGLKLALVFEIWGGEGNFEHGDINATTGRAHGTFARDYAATVGAPEGAIIYFAIDTDCTDSQYRNFVKPYLIAAKAALAGKFRIGVYACGYVCVQVLAEGLVDATWLTESMGFNGSRDFRKSGRATLDQIHEYQLHGLSVDDNVANTDDYGQFTPFAPDTDPVYPPPQEKPPTAVGRKIAFHAAGTMSTFGGPHDSGVQPDEGLALYGNDAQKAADTLGGDWVLTAEQAGAHGLARRINPDKFYLAARWPTDRYDFLRGATVWVENADGKKATARAVDWGPNPNTGRACDLSPGLAKELGLETDDHCAVTVYEDGK